MAFICREIITSKTNTKADILYLMHYLVKHGSLDKIKNVMVFF